MRATTVVIAALLVVPAACGSGSDEPTTTGNPICDAWTTMLQAQPTGDFEDDEARSEAFSAYADEVAAAIPAFENGAAETLERYEATIRAFADDPDDEDAVAALGEMVGPIAVIARGVAGICGVDVAEGR